MSAAASIGLAVIGVCGLLLTVLFMRAAPRLTFVAWAVTMFFVPVWIGVTVGFFWAAITILTIAAIFAYGKSVVLSAVDACIAVFLALVVVQFVLGLTTLSATVTATLEWVVPYIWGRLVLSRISRDFVTRTLAVCAVIVAVLAIIEFSTRVNIFVLLPPIGSSYAVWGTLQFRSGFLRAEGAWGHSIALGAGLGMTSTFVLATRWPTPVKLFLWAVVVAATVMTFSRIGLVTLVLATALSVLLLPQLDRAARVAVAALGVTAAIAVLPFVGSVFTEAGQEASGSADYRGNLFTLFSQVQLFGRAPNYAGLTVGGEYLGSFSSSVDNAFLVIAVQLGWVALALLAVALIAIYASALRRSRANPASLAVAAQVPGLFGVALITQFGMYFWFLVGLGVSWAVGRAAEHAVTRDDAQETTPTLRGHLSHKVAQRLPVSSAGNERR